jgi:hypothetical protein
MDLLNSAVDTYMGARSYAKSHDYAGRTPVPGPRMRRGCAYVRGHLAHVASGRVKASCSTKSHAGATDEPACAEDFAEHWGETGGTLGVKDREIRVRIGK